MSFSEQSTVMKALKKPMNVKDSGAVNNSPFWAWCLHSADSVFSGVPPWWLIEVGTQRERQSIQEAPYMGQSDISWTPCCLM